MVLFQHVIVNNEKNSNQIDQSGSKGGAGMTERHGKSAFTNPGRSDYPAIYHAGDRALLVEFGDRHSESTSRAVLAFDAALRSAPIGVVETAPTMRSVLIAFDPLQLKPGLLIDWCEALLSSRDWYGADNKIDGKRWIMPAVYGGAAGPDLKELAVLAGTTPEQVVRLHTEIELTVLCLGFSPGLAYLAELPDPFKVPRRSSFGSPVIAGSILVANRQTVLPATPIPTGWRCIGRTPARTFLPNTSNPFVLSPGDKVRFVRITEAEAQRFDQRKFLEEHGIERT